MTVKSKVLTPRQTDFLRGLCRSYIPSFNLIAVRLVSSDRQTVDGQTAEQTDRQMDEQADSAIT